MSIVKQGFRFIVIYIELERKASYLTGTIKVTRYIMRIEE